MDKEVHLHGLVQGSNKTLEELKGSKEMLTLRTLSCSNKTLEELKVSGNHHVQFQILSHVPIRL